MKSIKKILTFTLACSLLLVGCSSGGGNKPAEQANTAATTDANKTIIVGASPNPHVKLLDVMKPLLEKDGYKLEIKEFTDYIIPNTALEEKSLDANFFQHQPYLDNFQKEHKTHLVSVAKVHVEPMGLYSKKIKKLDDIKDGATIAIPNDPTNGGRALILLEKHGLLTIKDGVDKLIATDKDIDKNPKNIKIKLLDAAQLPRTLDEVDASVINTNYALEGGLDPLKDSIIMEDKDSPYANNIVVREGTQDEEKIKALVKAANSPEVKKYIEDTFKGAIVPAF